jgi:hypothetical protein
LQSRALCWRRQAFSNHALLLHRQSHQPAKVNVKRRAALSGIDMMKLKRRSQPARAREIPPEIRMIILDLVEVLTR